MRRRRPDQPADGERSRRFRDDPADRFWWHRLAATDYVPPLFGSLGDEQWALMAEWYAETEALAATSEINVPAMSLLNGLVTGNGISRIVQLGHYYGYSTLLLGFALQAMGPQRALVTIDIDEACSAFTHRWVRKAGLDEVVTVHCGDSADAASAQVAHERLGEAPELVLLDSSHMYSHTLRELDLWMPALPVGGLLLAHDASEFATSFDPTGEGGVRRALQEWLPQHPEVAALTLNGHARAETEGDALVYKDGCGLAILQRLH